MINYRNNKPTLEEFKRLRNSADWNLESISISDERAQQSLDASPFCVCAYNENDIVGMIRISGDSGMYGYIQDTIVIPNFQSRGVGRSMMNKILENVEDIPGYLLGVCPSKGSVDFYEKSGFEKRPEEPNGFMYMEIGSGNHGNRNKGVKK